MSYFKVNSSCNGCMSCVRNCPSSALTYEDTEKERILSHNMTRCARCGQCWRICPQQAILFEHLLTGGWDAVVTFDLIRCEICGEPIYPVPYGETLRAASDETLSALCPRHRQRRLAEPWSQIGRGKPGEKRP